MMFLFSTLVFLFQVQLIIPSPPLPTSEQTALNELLGETLSTPCDSEFIECVCFDDDDCNVQELSLNGYDDSTLAGYLSPSIGDFVHLMTLKLGSNRLAGTIPLELRNLKALQELDISRNNFTGTIPSELFKMQNLLVLDLSENDLSGRMPEFDEQCVLMSLYVGGNRLNGQIPNSIGNCKSLTTLFLGGRNIGQDNTEKNSFTGQIPISLCTLDEFSLLNMPVLHFDADVDADLIRNKIICYPGCMYPYLNDDFRNSNSSVRCQGLEDLALCSFASTTDVSALIAQGATETISRIESSHPIVDDDLFTDKEIVVADAFVYRLYFYALSGLRNLEIYICSDAPCSSSNSLKTFSDTLANLPGIGENDDEWIDIEKFYVTLSKVTGGPMNTKAWGFELIVVAESSMRGWVCSDLPIPSASILLSNETNGTWYFENDINKYAEFSEYIKDAQGKGLMNYAVNVCEDDYGETDPWTGVTCTQGQLDIINLEGFGVSGSFSSYFFNQPLLSSLNLGSNSLQGRLPTKMDMFDLVSLRLDNNQLTGPLPDAVAELDLLYLDINNNRFSGYFPDLSNLVALDFLDVSSNNFEGEWSLHCSNSIGAPEKVWIDDNYWTCYQECDTSGLWEDYLLLATDNNGTKLSECSPTQMPTFPPTEAPTEAPPSDDNSSMTYVIIGASAIALVLVLIVCYFRMKQQRYEVILSDQFAAEEGRQRALDLLPLHKAVVQGDLLRRDEADVMNFIEKYSNDITKLDYDGKTVLDLLLDRLDGVAEDVVIFCLNYCLPVKMDPESQTVVQVSPEQHQYSWTGVVNTDRHANVVERVLKANPRLAIQLCSTTNELGQTAISVASIKCRAILTRSMYFIGRYEILDLANPCHSSLTCKVHLAIDHHNEDREVALKFMKYEDQFRREVETRKLGDFSADFVVACLDSHSISDDPLDLYKDAIQNTDFSELPHCMVMPAAGRSLIDIITNEKIAGKNWKEIKRISQEIVEALEHMHNKGVIHADIKPVNILRAGHKLLIIDLDASTRIGDVYSRNFKHSTAFLPPELLEFNLSTGLVGVKSTDSSSSDFNSTDITGQRQTHFASCGQLVDYSHDVWAFGMIMYHLCTDAPFFLADGDGNISDQQSLKELCNFTNTFKTRRMVNVTDELARNMISQLLNKDPYKRPNFTRIQHHPFLTGKVVTRLFGDTAEYDIFLSYRVSSDAKHVEKLYELLTAKGLKVWWDKKCLISGEDWKKGFIKGLLNSYCFLAVISRDAINNPECDWLNYSKLTKNSNVDNVLLEQRLAVELHGLGYIDKIFPVMIGDWDTTTMKYSNYFASGCHPKSADVSVDSVEAELVEHMEAQALGSPLTSNKTVASVMQDLLQFQGFFVEGKSESAFQNVAKEVANNLEKMDRKVDGKDGSIDNGEFDCDTMFIS